MDAGAADGRKARAWAGRTAFHGTHGGHQGGMVNILEVHELHGTWESFQRKLPKVQIHCEWNGLDPSVANENLKM